MSKFKFLINNLLSAEVLRWVKFALVAVFALIVFGATSVAVAADQTSRADRERLVTINDNGTPRTIVTRATTVADALKDANITTSDDDNVEPKSNAELSETSVEINIYRARPIVVIDGTRTIRVVTMAQSEAAIAAVAGIKLYPEDKTVIEPVRNILAAGGAGLQLNITRAKVVNMKLYGQESQMRTHASTVKEFLGEKKIALGPDDVVSVDLNAEILDQMNLEVWRNGIQTITVDEEIAFETEQVRDMEREVGYREVKETGTNGQRSVVYEIEMKNGEEISRKEIQSVITKEPTKQIEVIGVKPKVPAVPSDPGANAELGHRMMLAYGFSDDNWPCLYNLWMRESGWRTNAGNTSSGAYGIPQSLPASKMASAGADYLTNPATQITWGLGYIKGRYGTPCNAWASFQSKGWY